jgi:photosystem II stability/assembly factor-like uncharacterized protein
MRDKHDWEGRLCACFLVFVLSLFGLPGMAEMSRLSPRASESLLLDAIRVGDRLVVAGEHGHILYSDDDGLSWTQAEVPTRQMITAIHFPSAQRGWAVGHDGLILASVDGGEHWTLQRDGLADQEGINRERLRLAQRDLEHAREALSQAATTEARAILSEEFDERELDLMDAEDILQEPVNAPPLLDVYFIDELHGVAVGAFNTLLRTSDGGISWLPESRRLDNPDEYHLNAITGNRDGRLWIAAEGGLLFRSEDTGKNWQHLNNPYHGSWFGILHSPTTESLLVFGLRGNVFRSEDAGDSWQPVASVTDRTLAGGTFIGGDYAVLVGGVGTLLLSDDGGRTFRDLSSGTRLHLSAAASSGDRTFMVGQGGIHSISRLGGSP